MLMKIKNLNIRYFPMSLLFLGMTVFRAQQMSLTVSGNNWTPSVPIITEAGNNYTGAYASPTNQILLSVSIPLALGSGRISVQYESNPTWNNALILRTRRTGNGTTTCVLCTISGGTAYQNITLTSAELFRVQAVVALAAYSNIPIQLELTGVSVTIPAAVYQSRVVFTIGAL